MGGGKILANDGVVLTPFGWKKGKDVCVGDLINNPDGSVQRVIQIKPEVSIEKWEVHFSDGTSTAVAEDHLWLAWRGEKGRKIKNNRIFGEPSAEVVETRELLEWIAKGYSPQIPICSPQPFNQTSREIDPLDPYLLGVLLGDGYISEKHITITCSEEDKAHYLNIFGKEGITSSMKKTLFFTGEKRKYLQVKLRLYGLMGKKSFNKFIPKQYLLSSIETRYEIVRGLMDTDGWSARDKNACYFDSTSEQLADDLAFILRSLGCVVTKTKGTGKYKNDEGIEVICRDVFSLYIKCTDPDSLFRMKRKQYGSFGKKNISKAVSSVVVGGIIEGRCITVSNPNGLYITNDFIVTHNSDALLMAALQYVDHPQYAALLLRDTYKNLSLPNSLMSRAHAWLANTDARWNEKDKTWFFPSGATITFGYLDGPWDHFNYNSSEFQYIGVDEACDLRWYQVLFMFFRLRKTLDNPVPLRFRAASNPGGISHNELKEKYIDPETREQGVVFISAKLRDNPYLEKDNYLKSLNKLDPVTKKRLVDGDWEIREQGRMFQREWFPILEYSPEGTNVEAVVRYWDLAATEEKRFQGQGKKNFDPAFTSGVRILRLKNRTYVIDSVIRVKRSPKNVEDIVRQTAQLDGKRTEIYMEQEPGSSGVNTIDHYRRFVLAGYTFRANRVTGSKSDRAMPFSSMAESRNIALVKGQWNKDFLDELEVFPSGKYKDQADAASGAFEKIALKEFVIRVRRA